MIDVMRVTMARARMRLVVQVVMMMMLLYPHYAHSQLLSKSDDDYTPTHLWQLDHDHHGLSANSHTIYAYLHNVDLASGPYHSSSEGALLFHGSSESYVEIPNVNHALDATSHFGWVMLIKPASIDGQGVILEYGNGTESVRLQQDGPKLVVEASLRNYTSQTFVTFQDVILVEDEWKFVCFTSGTSKKKIQILYADFNTMEKPSNKVSESLEEGAELAGTGNIRFGASLDPALSAFNGSVACLRFYDAFVVRFQEGYVLSCDPSSGIFSGTLDFLSENTITYVQETTTQEMTTQEITTQETTQEMTTQETTTQEMTTQDITTQEMTTQETTTQEMMTTQETTQELTTQETTQETTKQETTPQETTKQEITQEMTQIITQEITTRETTQETTKQETTPQETTKQETTTQETTTQEITTQEITTQETTKQETTKQETTSAPQTLSSTLPITLPQFSSSISSPHSLSTSPSFPPLTSRSPSTPFQLLLSATSSISSISSFPTPQLLTTENVCVELTREPGTSTFNTSTPILANIQIQSLSACAGACASVSGCYAIAVEKKVKDGRLKGSCLLAGQNYGIEATTDFYMYHIV